MKLRIIILSLATLLLAAPLQAKDRTITKSPKQISVLYLGGTSDWNNDEMGTEKKFQNAKDYETSVQARTKAFGDLLRKHFGRVTVMAAKDYKPAMSNQYDVTIFDGCPPRLTERKYIRDKEGKITGAIPATYLPADYHAASITIAEMGEYISQPLGIKNDWYCLCLDANAHSMNLQHPIFKGPFKTKITLHKEPTPEDAFHYTYFFDHPLPDSVMMWTVQKEGYKNDKYFRIGMVSRPWGYEEGGESENISSGVCAKTIDAVALGRHGNFFTWGFSASPLYMTDEAKIVFCNVVAYMANHKQAPVARKYNEHIATDDYIKEKIYLCRKSSYNQRRQEDSIFYDNIRKGYEVAMAKQQRGDSLNAEDKMYMEYYNPNKKLRTYGEYLKFYEGKLYDIFGEDETEYIRYYEKYGSYLYGGEGLYELSLDQDAWAWKIPVGDIRLLDRAVIELERGGDMDRANRVLTRYTLCEWKTPQEWRQWLNQYRSRIFFSKSGGWFYLISGDPNLPGNDYSVVQKRKDAKAKAEAAQAQQATQNAATYQVEATQETNGESSVQNLSPTNPVNLLAEAKKLGKQVNISITFDFYPGYHVYAKVGADDPYIPVSIDVEMPQGAKLNDVALPKGKPFGGKDTEIYDSKTTIVKTLICNTIPQEIKVKVGYQTCDDKSCLPPVERMFNLKIK